LPEKAMLNRHSLKLSAVLLLQAMALLPAVAGAQSIAGSLDEYRQVSTQGNSEYLLDIDNDSLLLQKNDGFYSSGLRISRQSVLAGKEQTISYGWRFGQDIYTASDIRLQPAQISSRDHPYAGWLYGGLYRKVEHADGSHLTLGLDIGCLGPCAGGNWTQTNLHRLLHQPEPQGWSTQVRNEAGVVLYADVASRRWKPASWLDITPNVRARLGNIFTDIGAGATLRAGQLDLAPGQATLHGFLRLEERAVGYNATLQGGYFSRNNAHTVSPKRAVGEIEVGIVWHSAPFQVKAGVVRRASEIRGVSEAAGAQNFASLQFAYAPD
jgi:lipid A 3-O-deacylase